jgi:hypothetical protein
MHVASRPAERPGLGAGRRGRYRGCVAVVVLLSIGTFGEMQRAFFPTVDYPTGSLRRELQNGAKHTVFIEGNTTSGRKCQGDYQVYLPSARLGKKYTGFTKGWYHWTSNNSTSEFTKQLDTGVCCIPSEDDMAQADTGLKSFGGQCGFLTQHEEGGKLRRGDDEPCDNVGGAHFAKLFSFRDTSSYLHMYYCTIGAGPVAIILLSLILCLMFILLGSTAEDFFCPALSGLSEMLGLRPRVAGVTLLALGNGAPDVFSIIASVNAKEAAMAVGEVTGAGNFVTTAVVGAVALVTPEGLKARGMFIRDVIMLIIATLFL